MFLMVEAILLASIVLLAPTAAPIVSFCLLESSDEPPGNEP